jgi:hypothetical protein
MLATADTDRSGDRPPAENAGTEEDEAGENKMSVVQQQMMTERPPALQKRMLQEWLEYGGEQVESCMRSGGIAMLDARWLVNLWDRFPDTQLSLSRRQDLPRKAFLSVDELRVAGCPNEGLPIVVVSAPWLSPFHPDPKGAHLRLVAIALKALLAGGKKYGVFWDWGSIVQPKDRSKEYHRLEAKEQASFDDAMSGLFKLFTHDHTTVFRLTRLPEDFPDAYDLPDFGDPRDEKPQSRVNNIAQYADRGWTFCESQWASWPCKETLDLGNLLDSDGDPPSDRQKLLRRCSSADSISPSVATKAFLHSIIPAPERSRSSFTAAALICIGLLSKKFGARFRPRQNRKITRRLRLPGRHHLHVRASGAGHRRPCGPGDRLRPAPARRWDVHCAPPRATRRCLQASSLPARVAQVACRERRYPPPPPPSGSSGAFRQAHYGRAHAPTAPLPVPDQFRSLATAWADLNRAGMSWADLLKGDSPHELICS